VTCEILKFRTAVPIASMCMLSSAPKMCAGCSNNPPRDSSFTCAQQVLCTLQLPTSTTRYCAFHCSFHSRFVVGTSPTAGIAAFMQIPIDLHPARFNGDRSSAGHSIVSRWRTTQVGMLICHRPHSGSATRRSCPVFAWRVANAALVALPKQLCQQCHPLPQQVLELANQLFY
jgi:hypothetical protein